jgi:signal transduction histidine kinase
MTRPALGKGTEDDGLAVSTGDHDLQLPPEIGSPSPGLLEGLSHDIRGPLTTISLALNLLRDEPALDDDRRAMLIDRAITSTQRIKALTDGVSHLGSVLRSLETSPTRRFDLGALVQHTVAANDTGERLVSVTVEEAMIEGNERAIGIAIRALLDNACLHTDSDVAISVVLLPHPDGGLIRVDDNGPGVPEGLSRRIFLPFDRGSAPQDRPGHGLGLAIVAAVARFHAGNAWVEETLGGGASFRMRLRSVSG